MQTPVWLQIAVSIASVLSTAIAAFSAWQSRTAAVASKESARDSREALAQLMKPDIRMGTGSPLTVTTKTSTARTYGVTNSSSFDASDVELTLIFPDGRMERARADVLKGSDYEGAPVSPAQDLAIRVDDINNHPTHGLGWKNLTVRFSDRSGHARWERRYDKLEEPSIYDGTKSLSYVETRLL